LASFKTSVKQDKQQSVARNLKLENQNKSILKEVDTRLKISRVLDCYGKVQS